MSTVPTHTYFDNGPLFTWAEVQGRLRRPLPAIVRRVAIHGRISDLHAAAFCAANGLGPAGAR